MATNICDAIMGIAVPNYVWAAGVNTRDGEPAIDAIRAAYSN